MNPLFLLAPIILPIAGGFLIMPLNFTDMRRRGIYSEAVVTATSLLVWLAIFFAPREPFTIYSFTHGFSITFRIDGLSCLFAGMIAVMWPLVMLYTFEYMKGSKRPNVFFAFYTMTFGAALGVAFSADMITLYVFYELLTLVTIPLVTHYGDHDSMFAARKYAAYTIGGASLTFFTVVMTTLYGDAGAFLYGGSLGGAYDVRLMRLAFLFGFFGFGTKAAVFPLHDWLPTASAAPTPVTALLHAVAVVNSGVFCVIRMTWYVYGPELLKGTPEQRICLMTAVFTLLFAAVAALREKHFKRRLAYSTVSNLSYMLFGILLLTPDGLYAGTAHMLFHGIIKMALFLCAGAFMHATGQSYIYEISGAGKRMPVTFTVYTLGALSLTGIPLFCGFISKWQLLRAGVGADSVWAMIGVGALIASAFLCAMYTLTISVRAFFPIKGTDRYGEGSPVREVGRLMQIPMVFFAAVNVAFGVWPGPVMAFIRKIAEGIL